MKKNVVPFIIANHMIWNTFPEKTGYLYELEEIIERIQALLNHTTYDTSINIEIRRILKLYRFYKVDGKIQITFYTIEEFNQGISLSRYCAKKPRGYLIQVEDGMHDIFYSSFGNRLSA